MKYIPILLTISFTLLSVIVNAQNFDHSKWNQLLQSHVGDKGNVNYKAFKNHEEQLDDYLELLSENKPKTTSNTNEKLAYWINAYNAFTVKLIVDNYPIKSIKDINKPWDKKFIPIDGKLISLNYIEHEILRNMNEPRIHFAIVCASYSCPKLQNKAFTFDGLKTQLANATKEFLADTNRNEISKNNLKLSKIFDWFSKDFTKNGSLIDFLNQYSEVTISPKAKKRYKDYNWSLNE